MIIPYIAATVLVLLYLLSTLFVFFTITVSLCDYTVEASQVQRIGAAVILFSFWYVVMTGGAMMLVDMLF